MNTVLLFYGLILKFIWKRNSKTVYQYLMVSVKITIPCKLIRLQQIYVQFIFIRLWASVGNPIKTK